MSIPEPPPDMVTANVIFQRPDDKTVLLVRDQVDAERWELPHSPHLPEDEGNLYATAHRALLEATGYEPLWLTLAYVNNPRSKAGNAFLNLYFHGELTQETDHAPAVDVRPENLRWEPIAKLADGDFAETIRLNEQDATVLHYWYAGHRDSF